MTRVVRLVATLLLTLPLTPSADAATASARPNIVFFIADNWSWPHAGALGDATARTPVFDRLAREGVLFPNAFCPVPSCSPTRSCILTGQAAHRLADAASLWSAFPKTHRVFTEALRDAGYEVGFSGKGWSPGRYKEFGWTENPVGREHKDFAAFMAQRDPAKPFFFWSGNVDTALHQWSSEPEALAGLDARTVTVPPELPDDPVVRAKCFPITPESGASMWTPGAALVSWRKRDCSTRRSSFSPATMAGRCRAASRIATTRARACRWPSVGDRGCKRVAGPRSS